MHIFLRANNRACCNCFSLQKYNLGYDPNRGSFSVANYPLYDPLMIAEICFPKLFIRKANYIEPTLLLHYQKEPSKLIW